MALILSIETSTTVCSAALHNNGNIVASEVIHTPNSAAGQLAVLIDKVLGGSQKDLEAVAVSSGPGSYTGLRIGVATAKGICYGLDLPLISISSLHVMTVEVHARQQLTTNNQQLLCPMIDARRMEVYTTLFDSNLVAVEPIQARIIDASSYSSILEKHHVAFFGNGSDKCKEVLSHPNATFIPGIFPSAQWLGKIADTRFREGKFEDVAGFEPFYLKDFIAKKPKLQTDSAHKKEA